MLPSLDFNADFLIWMLVTVGASWLATGLGYGVVEVLEERSAWVGPPGLLVALLPYNAWVWGVVTSAALMLFEAGVASAASVPGSVGVWALRAGLATAAWFAISAVGGSMSDWDALFILTIAGHVAALVTGSVLLYSTFS